MMEWAFYRTRRFRDGNETRDAKYPPFRRNDVKNWKRWRFYPGAIFMMPTRCLFLVLDAMILVLIIK